MWNKKYMAEIGLSAEQQTKVEGLKTSSNEEVSAVKADVTLSEDAKKAKLQDVQKKRMTAIEAVLTDDQKKKVEEIKSRLKKESENKQ